MFWQASDSTLFQGYIRQKLTGDGLYEYAWRWE